MDKRSRHSLISGGQGLQGYAPPFSLLSLRCLDERANDSAYEPRKQFKTLQQRVNTWECKTDPVRFKRGFEDSSTGFSKDKFAIFEAIFSYKNPMPETRKAACKTPFFTSKKGPVLKRPLNWTGSLFPLLKDGTSTTGLVL